MCISDGRRSGKPESATITPAFFNSGGWTAPTAVGKLGGLTYMQEVASVIANTTTPQRYNASELEFIWICQWNEYAGAPNGTYGIE
jgi:hypothetical protein